MIDLGALVARIEVDGAEGTQQLENFSATAEGADRRSSGLAGSLKKLAAGFDIGAAVKKTADAIVGCVKKADELKQSYNMLQTQTGATDAEMAGLEQSLKSIYANNYGESFEDIATAIAEVKKQTGLAGDELEAMAENAIALRDTFGFEVQESTRAADTMMQQFGITADEAFNLIAQGSQNGLDKDGNLLDSINEYSEYFKQLGFDSEEMFNMFANGAKSGVFDIDKLGDAVKEFGIRVKDGSNTTLEAYQLLGLNADELQRQFAEGGEGAKKAFQTVAEALNACEDEVVKNTAGVNLFGTMWEDMGADAVEALTDTNGEMSKTADTLESIKEIKYDDLGSAIAGIGRQMVSGLAVPVGEMLLPLLIEFANWIQEHMPTIEATVGTVLEAIGVLIGGLAEIIRAVVQSAQTQGTIFNAIWENIKVVVDMVLSAVRSLFQAFAALFQGDWEGFWNGIGAFFDSLLQGLVHLIENQVHQMSEAWDQIKQAVAAKVEEIVTTVPLKFKELGKNILEGLWNGIAEVKEWLKEKVSSLADMLPNWVKERLGIHSPSRVFAEIGRNTIQGLAQGVKEKQNSAIDAMQKVVDMTVENLTNASKGKSLKYKIRDYGTELMTKYGQGIKEGTASSLIAFQSAMNVLRQQYDTAPLATENPVKTFAGQMQEDWTQLWSSMQEQLDTALKGLVSLMESRIQRFKNAGKLIFKGVWDGMKLIWKDIKIWVEDKTDWMKNQLAIWESSKKKMGGDSDGSHRTGLYSVPFDDYRAVLHKGEMVLTQPEADRYRKQNTTDDKGRTSITQNFYNVREEKTAFEVYRETKKMVREMGMT